MALRVQEHNYLSGKNYLRAPAFADIPSAYRAMVAYARRTARELQKPIGITDEYTRSTLESDQDTTITVRNGRAVRVFSLVIKRGTEPVPFGHLLKKA